SKILFLDVDGVLHPYRGKPEFSPACMLQLRNGRPSWYSQQRGGLSLEPGPLRQLRQPIGCTPEGMRSSRGKLKQVCGVSDQPVRPG
ncbi:unnamed protein product, partial [Polarella glacialis]